MLDLVFVCHQCSAQLRDADHFCSNCGMPVSEVENINKDPLVGRTIGEAYLILDLIGSGGMGRVYRAEQKTLGRTVAIKVIHPHLLSDPQTVARFYTEARAASRLNHPNSVSIIDFGRTEDEILYLVMEYLQGRDLGQLMCEDGPLAFVRLCEIVMAILTALGEAHALNVIHRDLKPENIFLERTRTGRDLIKVVDFGLAKLISGPQATSITSPGLVCGTPDYMSPEQGRGEEVDGRGDIYSVGVLLFELLTEKLPFSADTPTKLVLKHIREKVPDPRQVAPHRHIPQALVEVTLRALEKNPSDRFQSADEMIDVLQKVVHTLSIQNGQVVICTSCGKPSPEGKLFCAECGANLKLSIAPPMMQLSIPSRFSAPPELRSPFIDRLVELDQIEKLRQETKNKFISATLLGEPGVGKTRLMVEAAENAHKAGDLVRITGPYESGDPVPYWAILNLFTSLYDVEAEELPHLISGSEDTFELLSDVGLKEVLEPVGLVGTEAKARAAAVACALVRAIRSALMRTSAKRMVLMVDDLDQCDGLTYRVLRNLSRFTKDLSLFLLTTCNSSKISYHSEGTVMIPLQGLTVSQSHSLVSGIPYFGDQQGDSDSKRYLPLYLEQLKYLGFSLRNGDSNLPPRLADAVAQRLQKLGVSARRVLQAISVLGFRCSRPNLIKLAGIEHIKGLDELSRFGFVIVDQEKITVSHPFIRDLVQAFIPAQARKELHAQALDIVSDQNVPLEVRVSHAYKAKETFSALMLLERMGDLSISRGDLETSVASYQHGLELARHDMLETGDTSLDTAVASFSYKLGSALVNVGDLTGAQGVLHETLEFTEPFSPERVRILIGLGKAVSMRKRHRDAYRLLSQALEIALKGERDELISEVYLGVAAARKEEGDKKGVVEALRDARERQESSGTTMVIQTRTLLELIRALIESGDLSEVMDRIKQAERYANQTRVSYLISKVHNLSAQFYLLGDNIEQACIHYHKAIRFAAMAGDAESVEEYEQIVKELDARPEVRTSSTLSWEKQS